MIFFRKKEKILEEIITDQTKLILPYTVDGRNAQFFALPLDEVYAGVLILGQTGTGKTDLIKTIFSQLEYYPQYPVVVFDPKGDYLLQFGKKGDIVVSASKSTHSWNIFGEAEELDDYDEIASEIFSTEKTDFWLNSAQQLFSSILKMMSIEAEKQRVTPTNADLWNLINTKTFDEIYALLEDYPEVRGSAQYISPQVEKQAVGVMSTLQTKFNEIFTGDFRRSNRPLFSISNYMQNPDGRILFIEYDITHGERVAPIYRLLLDTAIKCALSRGTEHIKKYFIIDEFSLIPHVRRYQALLNVGRTYRVSAITGIQAVSQLEAIYGHATTMSILAGHKYNFIFRIGDAASMAYAKSKIGDIQEFQQHDTFMPISLGGITSFHQPIQTTYSVIKFHPFQDSDYLTLPLGCCIAISPEGYSPVRLLPYGVLPPKTNTIESRKC